MRFRNRYPYQQARLEPKYIISTDATATHAHAVAAITHYSAAAPSQCLRKDGLGLFRQHTACHNLASVLHVSVVAVCV